MGQMRRLTTILLALMLGAAAGGCVKVNLVEEVQPFKEKTIEGSGRDKVLVLDISGIITSSDVDIPLSAKKRPSLIARIREALDRARTDHDVKAVVLRINSPGGGVTASDTLYHELRRFKEETGTVIVAHIMDIGASGGYYAALAADAITAQPTSVTGSIGVIMYRVDATGLMQKIGVQAAEVSSGSMKSMGSPLRPLSEDERRVFQSVIDSLFQRFVGLVAESRKLSPDAVRKLADGRIFTSQEAWSTGLIDEVGYIEDSVALAKKKAGLSRARVVMYLRPGEYRSNLYSLSLLNIDLGGLADPGAQFLYLWRP
jgi:protease-4